MNKGTNLLIVLLLVIIAIGIFMIALKPSPNNSESYQSDLCAKDYGDSARYRAEPSLENNFVSGTGDEQLCMQDCAEHCSGLNLGYSNSNIIDNSNCEPCDSSRRQQGNCYDCQCFCD